MMLQILSDRGECLGKNIISFSSPLLSLCVRGEGVLNEKQQPVL